MQSDLFDHDSNFDLLNGITQHELVIAPAKVLITRAKELTYCDILIPQLFDVMSDIMQLHNGLGLAAPQINVPSRFIVIKYNNEVIGMLNPVITNTSDETSLHSEGCLSVPSFHFSIRRYQSIAVQYTDTAGNDQHRTFGDVTAQCIQHEIDHLNGITIIQSGGLNRGKRRIVEKQLRKYKGKLNEKI